MHNLVVYNCIHKIARRILEDGSYYSTDTPARYRNGSPSRKIYSNAIDIDPSQLPPPWKRELENRFAKTVSLTFSLSLSPSLSISKAQHVDTRYCSKTWIINEKREPNEFSAE